MNQKAEKPTIQGQRIKTRKRDEKEKYDPSAFRDAIVQGLNESDNDLEKVSKFLDVSGGKLDYKRYAEPLIDILFAGGILAPGGSIVDEGEENARTQTCVFGTDNSYDKLRIFYGVFFRLIRRYKYLERSFDHELKKLVQFLRGFSEEERQKLSTFMGISLSAGLGNAACLTCLYDDHLVKEGIAIEFASCVFKAWLQERDMNSVGASLKKAGIDSKLLNLLPINKRTVENFDNHFKSAGLDQICEFQRVKASAELRKTLQNKLVEMIKEEDPVKDIINTVKEEMKKIGLNGQEVIVMAWNTIMNAVEWNKKEDLVSDQTLRHLRIYAPLLAAVSDTPSAELLLIQKVQEHCYNNTIFMKTFSKIVVLFYKSEVISEDIILKWYKEAHLQKGKSVFLEQTKTFVEWLENAEEESDEED